MLRCWTRVTLCRIKSALREGGGRVHFHSVCEGGGGVKARQRSLFSARGTDDGQGTFTLARPLIFAVVTGGCSFAGAAIWQYETVRSKMTQRSAQHEHNVYGKAGSHRYQVNSWWNTLTPGSQLVVGIIALNTAVFGLWRVPSLRATMTKWFLSSPASGARCWSMLLSTFSHFGGLHLAVNMYVLWSFAPVTDRLFGREHFLAFYLTGGVMSSLSSYIVKYARRSTLPSVGASGALMALIGAFCWTHPDAQLGIAFISDVLPLSFSAKSAMQFLIVMDVVGVLLRWKLFDHAAHLGGMLFGIWYASMGHKLIWERRETLLRKWHQLRTSRKQ